MVAGIHRSLEGHGTDMEGPSLQPGHKHLVAKKTPTTRIDVAELSHNHEADESRSWALGVVSAVALLPALGVDVHPSGRLCLAEGQTPRQQHASCSLLRLVVKRSCRHEMSQLRTARAQLEQCKRPPQ